MSRPWERRRYWLPEGWTAPSALALHARVMVLDSTRSHHHRQARNLAHEEGVRVLAEDKRAKRRARNLALRAAAIVYDEAEWLDVPGGAS